MSDENLGEGLNESYRQHKRAVAIKHLGERPTLTLAQIARLVSHDEHGDVVGTITLQELLERSEPEAEAEAEPEKLAKKVSRSKVKAPAKSAKKASKSPAKKAAKAATASKKGAATSAKSPKADKGKPKPRLDYDQGCREVMAALKAAKAQGHDSLGRSAIEEATGFTGVQVRAFAKKLASGGKVQILGEGGRSTTYALA